MCLFSSEVFLIYSHTNKDYQHVFQVTERAERTALSLQQLTSEKKELETQVSRITKICVGI